MKVLSRTVTVRQLVGVSVLALALGVGGTAVADGLSKEEPSTRANLGSEGGFSYRSQPVNIGAGQQSSATAFCPNSKSISGGGFFAAGGYASGAANSSQPVDGGDAGSVPDDGWRVYYDNYTGSPQQITAYAVCR